MTEETNQENQFCYKHPDRITYLRCNRCGRPICQDCAVLTPTGYRCKDCIKEQQKVFDTSETKDYIIGGAIALVLGYVGSQIEERLSVYLYSILAGLILGALAGKLICFLVRKAVQGRRSRLLAIIVTAAAGIGAAAPRLYIQYFYGSLMIAGGGAAFMAWLPQLIMALIFPIALCATIWMDMNGIILKR